MTNAKVIQTASGHQVLAAAGKKYLRPGGTIATQLFQWANFQPGEILELASSFGYSAMLFLRRTRALPSRLLNATVLRSSV